MPNPFALERTQTDADALAYISAASITDPTQVTAAYTLIESLKALNLWSKITELFPFIGGTAASHAVNAKNPGTNNITWTGTVLHDSNGPRSDGSTGYGTFGKNASAYTSTSVHAVCYSSGFRISNVADFGQGQLQLFKDWGSGIYSDFYGANQTTGKISDGFYALSKPSAGTRIIFNSGFLERVKTGIVDTNGPAFPVSVCCLLNSASPVYYSQRSLKILSFGTGLTVSELTAYKSIVDNYQRILGRAV